MDRKAYEKHSHEGTWQERDGVKMKKRRREREREREKEKTKKRKGGGPTRLACF